MGIAPLPSGRYHAVLLAFIRHWRRQARVRFPISLSISIINSIIADDY